MRRRARSKGHRACCCGWRGSVPGCGFSISALDSDTSRCSRPSWSARTAGIDTSAKLLEFRGRASGRLIPFHLADPKVVVQHHLAALRPGGLLLAIDFDVGSARAEPNVPLAAEAIERMIAAFRSAGAHPMIRARLAVLLARRASRRFRRSGSRCTSPRTIRAGLPC